MFSFIYYKFQLQAKNVLEKYDEDVDGNKARQFFELGKTKTNHFISLITNLETSNNTYSYSAT